MNFTDEQLEVIQCPIDEKTLVIANPASGKTACLIGRLKHLLDSGVDPTKIVAITFTNNAANEMIERLGDSYKPGLFIGTMHSYANYRLQSFGIDTSYVLSDKVFDELFELVQSNQHVLEELDYLLCDESQDLDEFQMEFITELLRFKGCLIVGDPKQTIYDFRGSDPRLILRLANNGEYVIRNLTKNFRNALQIFEYSNDIMSLMTDVTSRKSECMRTNEGSIEFINFYGIPELIQDSINNYTSSYKDWAILCRSNNKVYQVTSLLERYGIPCINFRQGEYTSEQLKALIGMDAVKVLTIHSSKGLEFPRVVLCDISFKKQEEIRLSYVGVTRAENYLYLMKGGNNFVRAKKGTYVW